MIRNATAKRVMNPSLEVQVEKAAGRAFLSTAYCILVFALVACFTERVTAEVREPPRRELWVPTKHLDEVLRHHPNAVLLDRAQYEALIRDAGRVVSEDEESKPPADAVVEGAKLNVELAGGAQKILIRAVLTVRVLGDRWSEPPPLRLPEGVVMTKFDGSDILFKEAKPTKDGLRPVLAVRGRGRHEIVMEFQSPVSRRNRTCTALLPYLGQPESITVTPSGSAQVPERWSMHDRAANVPPRSPGGTGSMIWTGPAGNIIWTERAPADAARDAMIFEEAESVTTVDGAGVTSDIRVTLRSGTGPLPKILKFKLTGADANVIAVDDSNVVFWKQDGDTLEIIRRSDSSDADQFHLSIIKPAPDGEGAIPVAIEVPRFEGTPCIAANLGLTVADDFEMTGWQAPGAMPDKAFRDREEARKTKPGETFLTRYEVAPERVIANLRRRGNHFSADVDNRIVLSTHDVTMERAIALHGEEGRVNRTTFTVPAGERFLGLNTGSGERIEWKQLDDGAFEFVWPGGLRKGQASTVSLKTRRDVGAATGEGKGTEALVFENLKVPEAIRLAGYVALEYDDSWKVSTTDTTGLETRDATTTPVKGRMAWFALRDYRLGLDIARNGAVLDAGVVAYALPRAKNVEIEGQVALDVSRAPLRKFDVKLPAATANLLRWDSPLISEQTLDAAAGTWHLTLRKELLGVANVRFHLSLPAEQGRQPASETKDEEPGTRNQAIALAATLPDFEVPAARRFTGAWVVEANTDTELSYETRGLQPLDALHAPVVEGYAPRHRVLAAYGYGSAAHELRITATRHEPGALVSAVVNEARITSVIGRDGVGRHEAALLVKHNGQQFFGIRLPQNAILIGARAGVRAVKPVRAGEDEVRVPLPANQSADMPVWIVVTYELRAPAWGGRGAAKLIPPEVGEGVPVLSTSWRVHAPDGYSFAAPETKLSNAFRDWGDATLAARSAELVAGMGRRLLLNPYFNLVFVSTHAGEKLHERTRAPDAGRLNVNDPQPTLAAMPAPAAEAPPAIRKKLEEPHEPAAAAQQSDAFGSGRSGLISLEIEIPAAGRIFEFHGHQRPDVITLRYESWELQMLQSVLWSLLGLALFFTLGRRRAWVFTIAAALLLTCVPVAFVPAWLVICNAVLAGWLAGFIVFLAWRLAQRLEKKLGAWIAGQETGGFAVLLCVCFAGFAGRSHAEEKPDPAAHTVIVPYDLDQSRDPQRANRYYLDYTEFQKLWELAKENRRPAKPGESDAKAAPEAFINSALYDARIEDDKLSVAARLTVLTRGAKWAKLPLRFKGDGLTMGEVKLDGGTALVEGGDVLVENPGVHAVEVVLQMPRGPGWKEAKLEIPRVPAAVVALTAPAADGRPILGGTGTNALVTEDTRGGRRVFTLPLGAAESFSVTRTPGRKLVVDAPPAQADTRLVLRVLPRLEKISADVEFTFSGTERKTLAVEFDPSLQLEQVVTVPAAETVLRSEGGRRFIDLHFPQTVSGSAKATLHAERVFDAATGDRSAPSVLGIAARCGSIVEVKFSEDLRVRVDAAGAGASQLAAGQPLHHAVAKTESGAAVAPDTGRAPLSGAGSYRLTVGQPLRYAVSGAEDRSGSRVEAVHQFTAQKAEIIAAITLDTGRASLADARIGVPPGFEVQTLTGPRVRSWHREGGFLLVRFDAQPQREAKLVLHLAKTSAQPTAAWKLEPLKLPQFARHEGAAFIAVHAADDVKLAFDGADRKVREVDPATLPSVVSVALPFQLKRALAIEKADWSAEVTLARQAPRFSADAILLARAGDLALGLSQQVGLAVEQGAVGGVKVRLPKSLPEARVHGALVRDAQSRIAGESREYEVLFQTEVLDRVDFTMDFDLPIEGEKNLPSVQVDGAARVQRFVIVDNAGAREMKLDAGGAEAAVKESLPYLPEGLVRPQFLSAGATAAVKLSFTQLESTAGNAAIITLAEITTALRANGERWETVVYSLANRSLQFLPVKLPEGAELVEASVSGQTVRADRSREQGAGSREYLIPLIQMRAGELSQQVRLVYRFRAGKAVEEAHEFQQPELVGLSVERTLWNVWVPEKFAARKFDGNMEEIGEQGSKLEKLRSELSDIARLNRALAGGNLSREEALLCWGNLNAKMEEVKRLQADNRSRLRGRLQEGADGDGSERLGEVVSQLDSDVERQIQQQGGLIASNSIIVKKAQQHVAETGKQIGDRIAGYGRLMDDSRQQAVQGWAFNDETQQRRSRQTPLTLNYARSGMVDLNDNVSLNGGEFFKSQSGAISISGGVVKANEGALTLTKSGAGTFTLPGGGKVTPSQQGDTKYFNAGNARAGQGVQLARQAAGTGDVSGGMIQPGSKPAAGRDSAGGVAFRTDDEGRKTAITQQLKPVGRVSLAVEVPLDGKVYHFSKLKDHALIKVTIVKPFDERQTGALWVLGAGLVLLVLFEIGRRGWSRRRGAVAL